MAFIKRGLHYLIPYQWLGAGALISTLVVTATNLIAPQLFQQLIDDDLEGGSMRVIVIVTVALVIIAVVRGVFNFTNTYWSEKASQGIAYDLRNELLTKMENLSFSFHDSHTIGQLMTRATSDVEGVRTFFSQGALQLLFTMVTFVGSVIILLVTDWVLATSTIGVIVLIVLVFGYLFQQLGPLFGRAQQNLGILN